MDDLIPAGTPASTDPPARAKRDSIACGFCEARLTSSGEVIKLSDRAKSLRDFEDDLEDERSAHNATRKELEIANGTIDSLKTQVATLQKDIDKIRRSW